MDENEYPTKIKVSDRELVAVICGGALAVGSLIGSSPRAGVDPERAFSAAPLLKAKASDPPSRRRQSSDTRSAMVGLAGVAGLEDGDQREADLFDDRGGTIGGQLGSNPFFYRRHDRDALGVATKRH